MMKSSIRENIDIRYKKVWRRKQKQEEYVNEELSKFIVSEFVKSQDHDESTGTKEDVKVQNDLKAN